MHNLVITPTLAGLTVGSIVGVVGFVVVLLIFGGGTRRAARRAPRPSPMPADQVVFIPPYGTLPRGAGPLGFVPSNELSARAFAKMGYVDDPRDQVWSGAPVQRERVERAVPVEIEVAVDFAEEAYHPAPSGVPAVTVAPIVMVAPMSRSPEESGVVRKAEASAPHPLGIIKASSAAMRAAPIADLGFDDDAPTQIVSSYPDAAQRPQVWTDRPRIRAVAPAGPRFPQPTPLMPQVMQAGGAAYRG